jgi:hypothetical protein
MSRACEQIQAISKDNKSDDFNVILQVTVFVAELHRRDVYHANKYSIFAYNRGD